MTEILRVTELWTPPIQNRLLRTLPTAEFEALRRRMQRVDLRVRQTLHHSGTPMEYVHFVESGLISVSGKASPSKWVEVWLIGSEGMTGLPVLLGDNDCPPLRRVVQVGGSAYRISRTDFQDAVANAPSLRTILLKYAQFVLLQTAQSAVCDANHTLKQRLGRWLLLARDGIGRVELPLTHQMLARLLGVRRASVTECLRILEDAAALQNARGLIRISDPSRLKSLSCGCYDLIRNEYDRLIG